MALMRHPGNESCLDEPMNAADGQLTFWLSNASTINNKQVVKEF